MLCEGLWFSARLLDLSGCKIYQRPLWKAPERVGGTVYYCLSGFWYLCLGCVVLVLYMNMGLGVQCLFK